MMFEWAYIGLNASIPRNVGPECANYLSINRRIVETVFISIYIVFLFIWSLKRISLPKSVPYIQQSRSGKTILLIVTCLVFGIEIGFKLSGKTFVYILNPCHIFTIVEIYLLAAEPSSPMVTAAFRLVLSSLNGPVLAFAFPETECRQMFVDKSIYYIQHALMAVIPYYLIRLGGAYSIEPFFDLSWSILGYTISLAYHFWILQVVGMLLQVNLSHMLCPAVLDPFQGQNYRLWATCHQLVFIPLVYKIFCVCADFFLNKFHPSKLKETHKFVLIKSENDSNSCKISNVAHQHGE